MSSMLAARPVIAGIESLSGQAYGASEQQNVPFRVIADHSRATAFFTSAAGTLLVPVMPMMET